jgi:hypothetical protein
MIERLMTKITISSLLCPIQASSLAARLTVRFCKLYLVFLPFNVVLDSFVDLLCDRNVGPKQTTRKDARKLVSVATQ